MNQGNKYLIRMSFTGDFVLENKSIICNTSFSAFKNAKKLNIILAI